MLEIKYLKNCNCGENKKFCDSYIHVTEIFVAKKYVSKRRITIFSFIIIFIAISDSIDKQAIKLQRQTDYLFSRNKKTQGSQHRRKTDK